MRKRLFSKFWVDPPSDILKVTEPFPRFLKKCVFRRAKKRETVIVFLAAWATADQNFWPDPKSARGPKKCPRTKISAKNRFSRRSKTYLITRKREKVKRFSCGKREKVKLFLRKVDRGPKFSKFWPRPKSCPGTSKVQKSQNFGLKVKAKIFEIFSIFAKDGYAKAWKGNDFPAESVKR